MKFLVLMSMAEGGPPPAPKTVDDLTTASKQWIQKCAQAGQLDLTTNYMFPEGGGVMILNADSAEELQELIHSNPSSPFLTFQVRILLDCDEGLDRLARHYRL